MLEGWYKWMSRFIEMNGVEGQLLVEIDDNNFNDIELIGIREKLSSLSNVMDEILQNGKHVIKKAQELSPDELEISFGIKGGIEAGNPVWGLAKASGEGHLSITIKWKK